MLTFYPLSRNLGRLGVADFEDELTPIRREMGSKRTDSKNPRAEMRPVRATPTAVLLSCTLRPCEGSDEAVLRELWNDDPTFSKAVVQDSSSDLSFVRLFDQSVISIVEAGGLPVGSIWLDKHVPHIEVLAIQLRAGWRTLELYERILSRILLEASDLVLVAKVRASQSDHTLLQACHSLSLEIAFADEHEVVFVYADGPEERPATGRI
ncbi:hypothetical protein [Gemmatimonas groenlandica]|uniref:N-acetyltransferase domain-containing protein n=1 Tax=Gemmatimonas groenlandica TaxID=2732249 RepID=A0A6M4IMP8_9BACT|nr:hypothetical protein [Gemmatimonas groenlandica]QJR35963.1 hypothetical protein HKW67_10825 [Gemmatimonas groenlandica]